MKLKEVLPFLKEDAHISINPVLFDAKSKEQLDLMSMPSYQGLVRDITDETKNIDCDILGMDIGKFNGKDWLGVFVQSFVTIIPEGGKQ